MDLARAVAERVPGLRVSDSPPVLAACAHDLWPRRLVGIQSGEVTAGRPGLVVWPERTEEVVRLIDFARAEGLPVVPFGAGSGVCGGVLPDPGTIVIDLKRLTSLRIDASAPLARVGAGLLGITLEEELAKRGLSAGHFPSSIVCSTVGGWVAARGAGQCSSRYGKVEDMLFGAECVLGTGEVVRMLRRRSAPDLLPLMTGCEGTLGVITEVALRLHSLPADRRFAAYSLTNIERGFDVLREIMQAGLRPAVARLYDPLDSMLLADTVETKAPRKKKPSPSAWASVRGALALQALAHPRALGSLIRALEGNLLGGSTLILIFEGEPGDAAADLARAARICARGGGRYLGEGPARAWYAHRYGVSFRQSLAFGLGAFTDTMEVSAPWSKLEALYDSVRRTLSEHALVMAHLSHAYEDGCSVYFTFSGLGARGGDALARYDAAWRAALGAVHAAGGTISHHHGVGRSKASALGDELAGGAALLSALRRAWDPAGILNAGALVPERPRDESRVPLSRALTLDERSSLATVEANLSLGALETLLERRGFTLGLESLSAPSLSLADWVAVGMPGTADAWSDPVRTFVAGFSASVGQRWFSLNAAPRRATGPNLFALFAGARGALGTIDALTLSVRRHGAALARPLPFAERRDPPLSASEAAAFERVRATLNP